jgi:hypothetical protein
MVRSSALAIPILEFELEGCGFELLSTSAGDFRSVFEKKKVRETYLPPPPMANRQQPMAGLFEFQIHV